ncbi:hypothetical protein [Variovorax sp. YR216]|uniref:hypothetical protein n=1 Tax=Variovorax sp. YR216 TaxID=1882828 RepID=UPI000897F110|nr:hypothetical protein [Variovorax sp. YR216]SEA01669.1 hypothetical protein SAMN05444680_101202 [Variovorax sp. YR216]
MSEVRLLAASLAACGAIVLGGCVAVPAGSYYNGGVVYSQPAYAYPYSYSYYPYPYYGWPSIYLSGSYGYYGGYRGGYWRPHGYPYWGHAGYYGPYRGGAGWVRRGRV